jgi:hypothetical protein
LPLAHGFNIDKRKTREGKRIWGWTDFWRDNGRLVNEGEGGKWGKRTENFV